MLDYYDDHQSPLLPNPSPKRGPGTPGPGDAQSGTAPGCNDDAHRVTAPDPTLGTSAVPLLPP